MLTVADFFCGAGGFSFGLKKAGFTPVFAVDSDVWSCETYARNIGKHVLTSPIEELDARIRGGSVLWTTPYDSLQTPRIDMVVGGPPCQGFSTLNRRAGKTPDPRNKLWAEYLRLLKVVHPKVFVIENVPQILKSSEFTILLDELESAGYKVSYGLLNAEDFGVPQRRFRAFIIGSKKAGHGLPTATIRKVKTVRGAFRGLPLVPDCKNLHVPRKPTKLSLKRYAAIPPGGNRFDLPRHLLPPCWKKKKHGSTDVFGRLWYDRPSSTIRTEFLKPEKGRYLHPEADRPITLREGARLQTFPDKFQFVGSKTQIAKQIGNAVPVKLAQQIGHHLLNAYFREA